MGLWDKLKQTSNYLRKLRLSFGPDSYFQYKRGRKHEREQADQAREQAEESAEGQREEAERGREYEDRYTQEHQGDIARERTEPAEEVESDR
jgi:hypothetical protein